MQHSQLTKSDLAWLIVRVFGVFFACRAIFSIITVINSAIHFPDVSSPSAGNFPPPSFPKSLLEATLIPILLQIGMAWYFLKGGALAHSLLTWTAPTKLPRRKTSTAPKELPEIPDKVTTLTPTEELEFSKWLEADSANAKGKFEDQIAKFRDYQALQR